MIETRLGRASTSVVAIVALSMLLLHILACVFHWLAAVQLPLTDVAGTDTDAAAGTETWIGNLTWLQTARLESAPILVRWVPFLLVDAYRPTASGHAGICPNQQYPG